MIKLRRRLLALARALENDNYHIECGLIREFCKLELSDSIDSHTTARWLLERDYD